MIVEVPTEVIPIWFIKKWSKENAVSGSPLDTYIKRLINEWKIEEIRTNPPTSAE